MQTEQVAIFITLLNNTFHTSRLTLPRSQESQRLLVAVIRDKALATLNHPSHHERQTGIAFAVEIY